jgi:amino acid adenylation domain-containing protein
MTESNQTTPEEKIAIIGIGYRFPGGASDHRTFWRNLINGKDCITETPANRYNVATLGSRDKARPGRLVGGRGGYIDGFDEFDPAFFGISPREADYMDPQQRKLLEVVWEALEDGGQKPAELAGRNVGVFIGAFTLDYKIVQFADLSFETLAAHTATGTMMTMVSNRISYSFDFRGPSISIDTACSSSLVAVHLACQSLRRRESCLAVAGGTLLHMTPQYTIAETKGGFLSPEGRSRTFDAAANGYVRAEGVAVVVLKLLDEAIRDGDPIHAVIIGSGVNQDGRTNGITVPSAEAQISLIRKVCAEAGIEPGWLQYVEAHGTSTPVGDPIEANALGRALSLGRGLDSKCYVGSVKTNIGHTESAAGVAGLIKTALSLKHKKIPPHINLDNVNPDIDLEKWPYEIPTQPTDWPEHEGAARAGVNSFGFGGTNAHVLLEEAPAIVFAASSPPMTKVGFNILPLTARDPAAFPEMVRGIKAELGGTHGEPASLRDVGFTLARRRQHLESRLSFVYSSPEDLHARLDAFLAGEANAHVLADDRWEGRHRRLVWVFTGMGPQWWAMGHELFEKEPVYRVAIERCDREIAKLAGWSLIQELNASEASSHMAETWLAQPASFAVQVGLAALWRSFGVRPDAIVGHSAGEVAAFYEAGVYSLEDAVKVIVHRSRLQQRLVGTGKMLAVGLSEEEALRRLVLQCDRVSIAAVNSPTSITLAGDEDTLGDIADRLQADKVFCKFLKVPVPYHSAKMEQIKDELLSSLADLAPRTAEVPLYVTTGGGAHGPEFDAVYWWRNVRDTVRFRVAVDRLIDDGFALFLEIGPHPVLGNSIVECLDTKNSKGKVLPSIRRQEDEQARFIASLAALHNVGVEIAWEQLYPTGTPVTLPRAPWKRDRYWIEPKPVEQIRLGQVDHPLLGRRMANAEPTWEAKVDTEKLPYMTDHRIQGNVVFPAAGYIEMASQAVRAMTGGKSISLAELEFRKALFLPEAEAKTIQLSFNSDCASFSISGAPGLDGQEKIVYATGTVRVNQRRQIASLSAEGIRTRAERHFDGSACYEALARMGYNYGPAFQGICEIWIGPNEALACVRPSVELGGGAADHHFHPSLLDACFQTLLTPEILTHEPGAVRTSIRLPLSIEEVRTDPVGDQPLWIHATISRRSTDEIVGDIIIYADSGAPLGTVTGFRASNVEKAAAKVVLTTIDNWLFDIVWIEKDPIAAEAQPDGSTAATDAGWLVFADSQGIGDQLAALVAARGERCCLVRPGDRFRLSKDGTEAAVVPGSLDDLARLFAGLAKGEPRPFRGILHLWNLDSPAFDTVSLEDLRSVNTHGSYSLVALARAMLSAQVAGKLFVVTRGVHVVGADDVPEPLGAPAWGIGRVLWYQELAGNRGKLIDLDPAAGPDGLRRREEAEALLREALVHDEDEFALRGGKRFTSRLRQAADLARPFPLRLRADACYLVTGAFGALGRLLCRMLVKRGARRLILMGRSKLPDRTEWRDVDPDSTVGRNVRFIKELEALGAEIIPAQVDITDEPHLVAWLADFRRRDLPPIRGIFHSAGQVRDTLITQMDRETFDCVYDPKVLGSYLLHKHLDGEPLEHFVLFSSIASLMTTAGQTNYAAGNSFLDALAHRRQSRGLPALSVDWGPWATGMIEELGLIDHYRNSRGMSCLSPEAGIDVLERVLGQDRAQILVATIVNWPVFLAWYPVTPPLVADIAQQSSASSASDSGSFVEAFRNADDQTRRALLADRFTALIADVLHVKPSQVDPQVSLNILGLDSLLAIELRARVNNEIKVSLPVVTLLSGSTVDQLVDTLYAALVECVEEDPADGAKASAVEIFTDEDKYPLTQNQKALWFLKQLDPDGFAYNIGGAVEVRTALDPELMFEAVRLLIRRHPSLRANFLLENGGAVQQVSPDINEDIKLIDVQDKDWDTIYQMVIREYRKPYDLEHDPLLRFRLFKRGEDRYIIMKAVHHIISDAISTFTFIEELLAIYEALRRGDRPELPPVRARYLDFLNWQNKFLAGRNANRMLEYWRQHLPAEVPILNLPTDKPRPIVQTNNGASEFFVLDPELTARIHSLSQESGATVFMILLSAYYILLHRYTAQDDIIVGSPVMGRTQDEFSSVYGYFVNPLPLHANLAGDLSFLDFLAQVQKIVLNGLDNQEYPFVLLVEKLGLQHDPSRSAVFQAMFILLVHRVATEKYGYRLEYIELPEEEGQFDLTLSAYEDEVEHSFHCVFKYNTDLFLPGTMRRIAAHYVNLLSALTRDPEQRIWQYDILGPEERETILKQWSGTRQQVEHGTPVHHLIGRIAVERPEAIAISAPSEAGPPRRLTYGELESRSNQLARHLSGLGVRENVVVGVCLDKSPELIISLLAVLKAGGAYLPLDSEYPADRLEFMVQNAAAKLVITGPPTFGRLRGLSGCTFLTLDESRLTTTAELDPRPLKSAVDLGDAAYVIYTSGSTGRPKGVKVTHGNLASAYRAWEAEYRLRTDTHVHLQMASFSFDVFTGDLVRALCSGGTLVLIPRDLLLNTARLYETMRAEQVDCGEFVPAVVRGLMTYCEWEGQRLDFMRLLIVGSDVWKVEEYRRLRSLCSPYTRLVNSYGLSEATIDSTYFEGPVESFEAGRMVPIGRPFPNSAVYILDAHGQPVPAGVPGELWVGGDGVAAGYVGDPEQTERRFVTMTLGSGLVRLYRTGDMAKWDEAGGIHLIGRADNQIKVRGHRIEVGEIESHLTALPMISRAVVVARQDARGETVLCAYCVPAPSAQIEGRVLHEHLSTQLPTFMIPSYFAEVAEFALTPNGKVDTNALPAPEPVGDVDPPRTLYEVRIAEHWKNLLGLEHVGLQHDFFELGGNSIKLIELIYHLQTEFNIAISVSPLFKVTTLVGMARAVEDIVTGRVGGAQPYLRFNMGREQTIYCFPPAGGHGLVYRRLAAHMPEYAFVSFNYLAGNDKVARYADMIESIQNEGPCVLFGYSLGGNLAFEVAKELERRGRKVPNVVIMDSYRILESFEFTTEHLEEFEKELREHLRKHTGSSIVERETLDQAKEYIHFCSRTLNAGTVTAPVSVISDEDKVTLYTAGEYGNWHGSSATQTAVFRGHGKHANMLDDQYVALNADLTRAILAGRSDTNAS